MLNCDKPDKETFFVDLDGTLCKFNRDPENVPDEIIPSVLNFILDKKAQGHYIVLTTARSEIHAQCFFNSTKISRSMFYAIITDLPRLKRTIINDHLQDYAPLAEAVNLIRDQGIRSIT